MLPTTLSSRSARRSRFAPLGPTPRARQPLATLIRIGRKSIEFTGVVRAVGHPGPPLALLHIGDRVLQPAEDAGSSEPLPLPKFTTEPTRVHKFYGKPFSAFAIAGK